MFGFIPIFGADHFEIPLSPSTLEQFLRKVVQTNAKDLSCSNPKEFGENSHTLKKYFVKTKNNHFWPKIDFLQ